MNIHISLIRCSRREYLGIPCWKRGISLNDTCSYTAHCLYGKTQRGYVKQEQILTGSRGYKSPALKRAPQNRRALCHTLIRINIPGRLFPGHFHYFSLHSRDSRRAAYKQNPAQLSGADMSII